MHHRQVREKFLRVGVDYVVLFRIPSCSLQVNTVNVASIFRFFSHLCVTCLIHNFNVKINVVDCNYVLSCVVLKISSDEGLREEETADPEHIGSTIVDPFLQELNSVA